MTYDQFLEGIIDIGIEFDKRDIISVSWVTGGMEGGHYQNSGANRRVDAEQEPEFKDLDRILERFCPDITYLRYKGLIYSLVRRTTEYHAEYYGNFTDVAFKKILLKELFQYLKELSEL